MEIIAHYIPSYTRKVIRNVLKDSGIPVHLKGEVADILLYRATIVLTVVTEAFAIYQLAMASFPKRQD
uniref:Cytochrome c oxidase subunit 7A2, mitochondrial n=1 Tax=Prolemur simus TaxID=1328070 RepID=A0A8C8ZDZ6_PROSS